MTSAVSLDEINRFFESVFPGPRDMRPIVTVMEKDYAVTRLKAHPTMIRPGGFISGPVQMGLADQVAYAAVFTRAGITPMALTSSLTIDFLRPCQGEFVIAEARIAKMGKLLAVMNVEIRAEGHDKVSSQAIVTYVLPPPSERK